MKKFSLLMLTLVFSLSLALTASAGEGSDTVGAGKLLPELRYSYTQTKLETDFPLLGSGTYDLMMHDIYAQLNWGVHPNVDIFGLVGARIESLDADVLDLPLGIANINAKYDDSASFLYGLGVKATFYRADNGFYIGGGLLFTHSFGEDRNLKLSGTVLGTDLAALIAANDIPTKISSRMITLTPDIHMGWHFKNIGLTPYLGVEYRWAWAEASYDLGKVTAGIIDGDVDLNFHQKDSVGVFVGLDYTVNDRLSFNVEGNMIDRWGVSAGVGYLFDIDGKPRFTEPSPFVGGAGAGSDTIGDCRVLPQVRYSYMQTKLETDFPLLSSGDYNVTTHDIYAQLNWGVHPNVDIFGLVGARIDSLDADVLDLPLGMANINAKYDPTANFLYGLGAKATFYRADNGFYIGGGVVFTHSFGTDRTLKLSGSVLGMDLGELIADNEIPTKISTRMITLTPDIHAGWHFKNIGLTPYVGVEYRWAWAEVGYDLGQVTAGIIDGDVDLNFHQKDSVGVFVGLDYTVNDRLFFNVEGNMIDRWGVSAGAGYLFDICEKPKPAPVVPEPVIEPKLEPMSKN